VSHRFSRFPPPPSEHSTTNKLTPPTGDTRVLSPILSRLTTSERLPILLIGGNHIPTDDILALKQMDLKQRITEAGAVVGGAAKKKKGK
jgi:hypothetical protein